MFKSSVQYTNRYGDSYTWIKVSENIYEFTIDGDSMKWCRYGGKEGNESVDTSNLGMFDPSGGPYVCLGMEIDGKPITRIYSEVDKMYVECKDFYEPGQDPQV